MADPPPRKPTSAESLWGKRFAVVAAVLAVVGVLVGGSTSAVFFVVGMVFLMLCGYCFRYSIKGVMGQPY